MMRKAFLLFSFAAIVFVSALLPAAEVAHAETKEITVSAAMSLKDAFEEAGKAFASKYPGARAVFNFGGSGALLRQIEGGAPVDVFASADVKTMDEAERKGLIEQGSRIDIAANTVVLVVPATSKEAPRSFEGLTGAAVRRIAVGNPKTVPAGRYAGEVLRYLGIADEIGDKLVFAENVRQVLDYVARGEVDAGITYGTDAISRSSRVRVVASAPEASHAPVVYPLAVVRGAAGGPLARGFLALVVSEEGRKILAKYGFQRPGRKRPLHKEW
jgi:molybdate transport system substrate-binding protein